jgi:hypothetical protein
MSVSSRPVEVTEEMHQVDHHFAQEHAFETPECGRIRLGAQVLKRLIKVNVGSGIVFVLPAAEFRIASLRRLGVGVGFIEFVACGGQRRQLSDSLEQ